MKRHLWFRRLNEYFDNGWPLIPFQPVLYFFVWGAAIRLWFNRTPPPNFDAVITEGFYGVWLALGIAGPMLALASWLMIRNGSGRWTFLGIWARLSADIQVFTVLITYHLVNVSTRNASEEKIFSRYIVGAALVFLLGVLVRDVWALVLTERLAGRLHREERE